MDARDRNNTKLGITLIISAMFVFATQDAITKTLAQDYAVAQILFVRFGFYVLFALAYSVRKKPLRDCIKSNAPVLQILRSLLILAEIGLFIFTIRYLSLAELHSLLATFPLMVTMIAAMFLGEKVGIRRWSAVLVGFIGVLVILRPGTEALKPIAMLGLLTSLMFAGYNVMTRLVARYDDGETSMVYMAVVGFVVTAVIGPFYWTTPDLIGWVMLVSLSFTASAGHLLLIKALEAAPASTLQPFNYTMLVFAVFYGWLIFDNLPDLWTLVGAGIVVSSGLYVIYREQIRKS